MSYSEYEQLYYKIVNEADELYGGQSEHFKKNLQNLQRMLMKVFPVKRFTLPLYMSHLNTNETSSS